MICLYLSGKVGRFLSDNMTKHEIRKEIKAKRAMLGEAYIKNNSAAIFKKIKEMQEFKKNHDILVYVSYNNEVDTHDFINDCISLDKNVYVPKVYGKDMKFIKINSFHDLTPGAYGIPEPDDDGTVWEDSDEAFMVMPGMAFDLSHHRAGYGGGFYDRFLKDRNNIFTVAAAFEMQITKEFETDEFDICPDIIVTQDRVF